MTAFYNELDKFPAQWMRNLITAGHIAQGVVDERSIADVRAGDLEGFEQCHFFAGIGVWSYALRRAGWPDAAGVWTGSCPCQPFSVAGKKGGHEDERHLWPVWFDLIRERRPPVVFGEQVASRDGLDWLDAVQADLEAANYAVGALDLCAAGVGAPHIRQRVFFVAYDNDARFDRVSASRVHGRREASSGEPSAEGRAEGSRRDDADGRGAARDLADAEGAERGPDRAHFWSDCDWIPCRDGTLRPVEPGTFPLAHGTPARVGRLRAYGNAIVAEVAEEFIRALIEIRGIPCR